MNDNFLHMSKFVFTASDNSIPLFLLLQMLYLKQLYGIRCFR